MRNLESKRSQEILLFDNRSQSGTGTAYTAMANFSDLPFEIWHLIAEYLPRSQLFKLKCLNSFFLNYWLDHNWKRVHFRVDNFDCRPPFRLLRRLKCVYEIVFLNLVQ